MAAASRMGAFSFGEKPKYFWYASTPLRPFRDKSIEDDTLDKPASERTKFGKGYGITLSDDETAKERFRMRRRIIQRKNKVCDWCVYIALTGLFIAIIDVEMHVAFKNSATAQTISTLIRSINIILTIILDALIVTYHYCELHLMTADTGHNAFHLGFEQVRRIKLLTELFICTICPLPCTGTVEWPVLSSPAIHNKKAQIPVHVILTLPMFMRMYLVARYIVLHSFTIQDVATRTVASLNQISVDFAYVFKTLICEKPMTVVMISGLTFWGAMSWMLTQCERYATGNVFSNAHYLFDYAWFEAVTFFAIGYGDIQVETYCGRSLAIFTGIVGNITSSLITVLLGQRMLLSLSERRVNQVIAESQLTMLNRNAAAKVLQWTWRTSCWRKKLIEEIEEKHSRKTTMLCLRVAQRSLLQSVLHFRRCRWKLRLRMEEEDDVIAVRRAFNETEDRLKIIRTRQNLLGSRMAILVSQVDALSVIVHGRISNDHQVRKSSSSSQIYL